MPLPVTIVIVLLLVAFVFAIHKAIISSVRWKPMSGSEGMIGLLGTVITPLNPLGSVTVQGELWKARSIVENISIGENVEIIGLDGLTLEVKRKEKPNGNTQEQGSHF